MVASPSHRRAAKMISSLTVTVAAVLMATAWAVKKLAGMAKPIETDRATER